jgi:SAM-dependent methyltransferase
VSHIQRLTSKAAQRRFDELVAADPGLLLVSWMVGERVWDYAHAVGPRDKEFRALVPNIPPEDLRRIVAAPEEEVFLWSGAVDLENFLNCFDRHRALSAGSSIFDFGCGCGRLSRFFESNGLYKGYASDVNPILVQWCKNNLIAVDTRLNAKDPPLPFDDAMFDCAYALSIFTHLPERTALLWLEEVSRVVKPNGVFIFTVHGDTALETIKTSPIHQKMFSLTSDEAAEIQRTVSSGGFWYVKYSANLLESANAGDEYGNSFVSESHIRNWLGKQWDLIEFIPGGLRGWHDMAVLRRK